MGLRYPIRVSTLRIVEAFDVVEHIGSGLVSGSVHSACCSLGFERGEEALHRRVVPDVARPAHRADDTVVRHQPLELFAGVLAATVGMMQQGIGFATPPDRHDQSIGDELGRHRGTHRPADHAP